MSFYEQAMQDRGFDGVHAWKLNHMDAACLFFRRDRFQLLRSETLTLKEGSSQVALVGTPRECACACRDRGG